MPAEHADSTPATIRPDYELKPDPRRSLERIATQVNVLVIRDGIGWHLQMADLSGSGCRLVKSPHCELAIGDRVQIYTTEGGGVPVRPLFGEIARASDRHLGVVFGAE